MLPNESCFRCKVYLLATVSRIVTMSAVEVLIPQQKKSARKRENLDHLSEKERIQRRYFLDSIIIVVQSFSRILIGVFCCAMPLVEKSPIEFQPRLHVKERRCMSTSWNLL